jgi:hypothetical protein
MRASSVDAAEASGPRRAWVERCTARERVRESAPGAGGGGGRDTDGPITFLVRVSIDEERDMTAVVERVRAGRRSECTVSTT